MASNSYEARVAHVPRLERCWSDEKFSAMQLIPPGAWSPLPDLGRSEIWFAGTRDFGVFPVIVRADFFGADKLWPLARGTLGGHGRRPRNREDTIILHREFELPRTITRPAVIAWGRKPQPIIRDEDAAILIPHSPG
jgi:hypothetical protein